jgi:phosphatidate cytidylyltransferase
MLKRIITAICAIIVLLPILWFSDTLVFPIALGIAAVLCLFEMFRCMGLHKNIALTLPLYASALAFPVLQRVMDYDSVAMIAFIVGSLYTVYLFALIIWSQGKLPYKEATAALLTSLYIIAAINMVVYIRDFGDNGKYLYFLIFIGAWVTDTFAYFTGVFFGKHKLIESVSPKKTIEGSIGGTLFCALGFVVMGIIANSFGCNANFIFLAVGGIIIAIISQIGDLIMSVIKRHYGVKDYGKLFPGHGGMLDRLDSILAVSFALAALCMFSQLVNIPLM